MVGLARIINNMNNKKIFSFLIIIVFVLVFVFLLLNKKNIPINDIQYVKIAGQTIKVDLALTPKTQEQGLSGRTELKENEGMLFVFNKPSQYSFWMKDMNFPIDIIWLGEDLRIVYIEKEAKPESYPNAFTPDQKAKFVLEVMSGFSEKNNLKEGDIVKFLP